MDSQNFKYHANLSKLQEIIDVQKQPGIWDHDPYFHGMLNGLILAHCVIADNEPEYFDPPKEWIADTIQKQQQDELHSQYPSLKEAWEQYQLLLALIRETPEN